MQTQHMNSDTVLISCSPGEEVLMCLRTYAQKEHLLGATFSIIGAVGEVELGYYDTRARVYHMTTQVGMFELVNATGNIAWKGEEPVVHVHGVCSNTDMSVFGGHVSRMVVSAACEIVLHKSQYPVKRTLDENIGLATWCLEDKG